MRTFLRAVGTSWPFRARLGLSIACAVFAAAFWILFFLAIHPAMKILGGEKSLPASVDTDIKKIKEDSDPARTRRDDLEKQLRAVEGAAAGPWKDERKRELTGSIAQTDW